MTQFEIRARGVQLSGRNGAPFIVGVVNTRSVTHGGEAAAADAIRDCHQVRKGCR